jgi:hypothetical protein
VESTRRTALIVGVLFLITFVTSIAAYFWAYATVLDHPDYIVGAGADNRIAFGRSSRWS